MRTTITLDDDVFKKINERIRKTGESGKKIYNDLLRSALAEKKPSSKGGQPFELVTYRGRKGLMPGFQWEMSTAQLLDKLDEDERKGS